MRTRFTIFWKNITYTALCRLLFFFYILIPIILKAFPSIFLHTVFSFKYKGPAIYTRVSDPERDWGFPGASNHLILSQSGNSIGLWHIPPTNAKSTLLSNADKVIIYCHGKGGNRASGHRTPFYSTLSSLGFHVVTFDYSGFGDSTGVPDGWTVKLDTISIYQWTKAQMKQPGSKVIIWGHSLGSAIISYTLAEFSNTALIDPPHGVILEAPFINLYDASRPHALFRFCNTIYPYLWTKMFKSSAKKHKMEFVTEKNILKLKTNILIIHAEDDPKVPIDMSQRLYDKLHTSRETKARSVLFYRMAEKHNCGHNLIYTLRNLGQILDEFYDKFDNESSLGKVQFRQFSL